MAKATKKTKSKVAHPKKLTRKEARRVKQEEKKEKKRQFFCGKTQGGKFVRAPPKDSNQNGEKAEKKPKRKSGNPANFSVEKLRSGFVASDDDESIASDFSDAEVNARMQGVKTKEPPAKKVKVQMALRPDAAAAHRKELQRKKDLENAARKNRVKNLLQENEDEDKVISKLEKQLRINKTKDKNRLVRKMFNDGLDYALELCLDDDEERQKRELRERRRQEQQKSDDLSDGEEAEGSLDMGEETEEESMSGHEEGDMAELSEADAEGSSGAEETSEQYKEDIYGRKRDKEGNVIKSDVGAAEGGTQKYIPPHQRALLAAKGDDQQAAVLARLRRHCKGQLNRLSEANLHKICTAIEALYMKNSRFNMNETLATLLNESLIGRTLTNERMVQEHMVLLAYLHAHIGSEIGAHFLQTYIDQLAAFVDGMATLPVEDKRLNNLILVLSYLYIFKIYEHRLLIEVIGKLSEQLCEKSIECLVLIFQTVGFKLRKDDPSAFKQMMLDVQQRIAAAPLDLRENLRLKFMVDILNAVKNNNVSKIPKFDPELAETLRKRLKAMLRNEKYVTTLNISMADLLRADQVGKWWIVGSAWSGDINDVASAKPQAGSDATGSGGRRFSEALLSLARQQKMNTDERRNVFCIIMSAEDYVDAFEKILQLALKDHRTIAYVVLHCCLNERSTNPYYAHLAMKFCNYNRRFQLAFQFAAWDRINDIDSMLKKQVGHLAHFLQHLILQGGLSLSVLKVVDFLQLHKLSFQLMRQIIVGLLLSPNDVEVFGVFERMAKNPKLSAFKNSIRLFVQHFLMKEGQAELKLTPDQLEVLHRRVNHVDNLLAYVDL